jgi:hypothetical protein
MQRETGKPSSMWSLISAVNNTELVNNCLLRSPDVAHAKEVILQTGYVNAALAYNAAVDKSTSDILVFAHQDVFLPEGWFAQVQKSLHWLDDNEPNWAVAGVWGVRWDGRRAGNVYCTGLGRVLRRTEDLPAQVQTLDELLLIVRKSSGIRFDEDLPGYHFYGSDICLAAEHRGLKCYAISAFCIHNTNGYGMLPWQFWKCYFLMRRKWRNQLPVITPCTEITRYCWPMIRWNMVRGLNILRGRHKSGRRVPDPAKLCRELSGSPSRICSDD